MRPDPHVTEHAVQSLQVEKVHSGTGHGVVDVVVLCCLHGPGAKSRRGDADAGAGGDSSSGAFGCMIMPGIVPFGANGDVAFGPGIAASGDVGPGFAPYGDNGNGGPRFAVQGWWSMIVL